jgi:hypothetical protein
MSHAHLRLLALITLCAASLAAPAEAHAWATSRLTIPGATFSGAGVGTETKCKDGLDNDGDGFTDRLDSDCSGSGSSSSPTGTISDIAGSADPGGDGIEPVPFWLVTLSTGVRELYALSTVDASGNATYLPFMTGVERITRGALTADLIDANFDGKLDVVLAAADYGKFGIFNVYLYTGASTYTVTRFNASITGDAYGVNIAAGLALDGDTLLVDTGHLNDAGPGYQVYNYLSGSGTSLNKIDRYWAVFDESTGVVTYR